MSVHTSRERWLLGATIASGLAALLSHGGGLTGCSTMVRPVQFRTVHVPLESGQQPDLVLTSSNPRPFQTDVARIERGTLVVFHWRPWGGDSATELEAALAGFDPARRQILFSTDGETTRTVDAHLLEALEVLGESPTSGYAGNGALIGGLTGAVIGGVAGGTAGRGFGGICAAGVGAGGGLVASGLGAGIGAIASPGRARTEYRLGPHEWHIASEEPNVREQPTAPATPGAPAATAWCALRHCNSTVAPDAPEPGPGLPPAPTAAPRATAEPAPAR